MASFVLDASVAISWCFPGDPNENTPYSRAVLSRLAEDDAIVPLATSDGRLRDAAIAEGVVVIG
jgi:hypothetical protein